jgi:hypothetical protein
MSTLMTWHPGGDDQCQRSAGLAEGLDSDSLTFGEHRDGEVKSGTMSMWMPSDRVEKIMTSSQPPASSFDGGVVLTKRFVCNGIPVR